MCWKNNMNALEANTRKNMSDIAIWSQSYGLWPGNALAIFAANSRWIHLSTNTLPFYNVFPRLEGKFPGHINIHADDCHSPMNHWLHQHPEEHIFSLSNQMARWLRWHDGTHVMLADKSEAGWYNVPDRGYCSTAATPSGEFTPEHVHYDYLHTDVYEQSREERGVEGAAHG